MRIGILIEDAQSEQAAAAMALGQEMHRQGHTIEIYQETPGRRRLQVSDWARYTSGRQNLEAWAKRLHVLIVGQITLALDQIYDSKRQDFFVMPGLPDAIHWAETLRFSNGIITTNSHTNWLADKLELANVSHIPVQPFWNVSERKDSAVTRVLMPCWWDACPVTLVTCLQQLQHMRYDGEIEPCHVTVSIDARKLFGSTRQELVEACKYPDTVLRKDPTPESKLHAMQAADLYLLTTDNIHDGHFPAIASATATPGVLCAGIFSTPPLLSGQCTFRAKAQALYDEGILGRSVMPNLEEMLELLTIATSDRSAILEKQRKAADFAKTRQEEFASAVATFLTKVSI